MSLTEARNRRPARKNELLGCPDSSDPGYHEAGRALDALVAEQVMGWDVGDIYGDATTRQAVMPEVPAYSTSLLAAWEVVQRRHMVIEHRGGRWRAGAKIEVNDSPFWDTATAWTAPHAICMAALMRAKGRGG